MPDVSLPDGDWVDAQTLGQYDDPGRDDQYIDPDEIEASIPVLVPGQPLRPGMAPAATTSDAVQAGSHDDEAVSEDPEDERDGDLPREGLDSGDEPTEVPPADELPADVLPAGGPSWQRAVGRDLRAMRKDLGDALRALDTLVELLQQLTNPGDRLAQARDLRDGVEELDTTVTELARGGQAQDPSRAFTATTGLNALTSEAETAKEDANEESPERSLLSRIWKSLKKVAPHLWSMISHLLAVKEWSVTGTVGTGILGFANGSISVTFGSS